MSLLQALNLRKTYHETPAVDDLSFRVEAGEIFGLLGPNGAGKTTTMMMLVGLLKPDAGSVSIEEEPFDQDNHKLKRLLGVVPQELAIYPELTASENLSFFGGLYGLRGKKLRERSSEVLQQIGLSSHADQPVGTFSGGMKRRLNYGVALLHSPRLLVLDEPTVGVDPQSRSHLLESIRRLSEEGVGVLYASHYMEEVEALCDRVAIIDHGRMLACDRVSELLKGVNSGLHLKVTSSGPNLEKRLDGLADVRSHSDGAATLYISRARFMEEGDLNHLLQDVLKILDELGVRLEAIDMHDSSLEHVFLELTGKSLRD